MGTINDMEIRLVNSVICEIELLEKGEITLADNMMKERINAKNRLFSLKCLLKKNDEQYKNLVVFLFQQTREMISKLIISV